MLIALLLYSLAHLILLTCMFKLGLGGVFINKTVLFLYCQFVYCTVLKLGSSYCIICVCISKLFIPDNSFNFAFTIEICVKNLKYSYIIHTIG